MDPVLEKINDEIEGHGFANREARLAWAIGSSAVLEARKQMQAYARSDFRIAGTPDQDSPASQSRASRSGASQSGADQSGASESAAAPAGQTADSGPGGARVAHFGQRGNGEANGDPSAERLAALETERQIAHLRQSVTLAQLRAFAFIADALIKAERSGNGSAQTMATLRAEYDQLWGVLQPLIEGSERSAARGQAQRSEPPRSGRSA
ncbi:MAG: hypothetical protein ACREDZ_01120 [Kiloniellales bacterium]